jgi:uncharacterized protein (TIGR02284 family)
MDSGDARAIKQLVKLDYDAIEAYDEAIDRLDDAEIKAALKDFRGDHARHTENLGAILRQHGEEVPDGPDAKQMLTKGKVVIADLAGDKAVLRAMKANEKITVEAYEKALRLDRLDAAARQAIEGNYDDEKRHKSWIDERLERM